MPGSIEITRDLDRYLYHEKSIEFKRVSVASATKFCTAFLRCGEIYITYIERLSFLILVSRLLKCSYITSVY